MKDCYLEFAIIMATFAGLFGSPGADYRIPHLHNVFDSGIL